MPRLLIRLTLLISILATLLSSAMAQSAISGNEKMILTMPQMQPNWVSFRNYNGRQLIYFTILEAYKCGIRKVAYSINSEALDQEWLLQPCNPKKQQDVTTNKPYLSLPLGTAKFIAVQLTFNDKSRSPVVHKRP
jgi:hypothetical protein